jgi:carbamoyl-phosphate synthase/aspartate carbamoyltransferase
MQLAFLSKKKKKNLHYPSTLYNAIMSSNFPIPSVAAAGTAPALNTGAYIPAPAANATPLPAPSPRRSPSAPHRPVTAYEDKDVTTAAFVLQDGSCYQGISFGSESKSISGECVFQTGK